MSTLERSIADLTVRIQTNPFVDGELLGVWLSQLAGLRIKLEALL